ncbi:YeeE/YedE family protein [Duganella sp. FT135W]|uniref:YeeE/YedE family protein n=1 Tax=Duganella flavida TaxID=2692175 RepID=A0A6L8KGQ3_9BURK|nr:YeeE/YedE thiosulfate transporter family protein [Duganella flavida]MYM25024.1 YeeE/YedE family protein [Duganella flavida]
MTIDWNVFTPGAALAGGVLIGLAVAVFVIFNGRIAGISGIIGGLIKPIRGDTAWRLAFIAGLIGAPLIYGLFFKLPEIQVDADTATLIIAGLIVGIGTRYGSGCTSGHGVCGISRLSPRSIIATLIFMAAGFIAVFLVRHL